MEDKGEQSIERVSVENKVKQEPTKIGKQEPTKIGKQELNNKVAFFGSND